MIIISNYRQEHKNGMIYIRSEEESVCPICQSSLKVIGSRHRVVVRHGFQQTLVIRRLRCHRCMVIHHELPDILIPYKRHCAYTIDMVFMDNENKATPNMSTAYRIRRWWHVLKMYFAFLAVSLNIRFDAVFSTSPTPAEIARAMTNSHSWTHTHSVLMSNPWMNTA